MPFMLSESRAVGYRILRSERAGSDRTKIWLVTHSERRASATAEHAAVTPLTVIKRDGETGIEGLKITGEFRDEDDA